MEAGRRPRRVLQGYLDLRPPAGESPRDAVLVRTDDPFPVIVRQWRLGTVGACRRRSLGPAVAARRPRDRSERRPPQPGGTPMSPIPEPARELAPTGRLRVAINLGNPVLTHGTPEDPGGVSVAIAREVGRRLGVPVDLRCVDAARLCFAALAEGRADLTFLAVEPARETEVRFSPPYLTIEGVYVAAADGPFATRADVDRPGVRVGVKEGSAYDLFLTRTLVRAEVVRGADGVDVYVAEGLDVGAGIRQPMTAFVADGTRHRVLEPAFMQIPQAVGIPRERSDGAAAWVAATVRGLLADGFVRSELARAGQDPDLAEDLAEDLADDCTVG